MLFQTFFVYRLNSPNSNLVDFIFKHPPHNSSMKKIVSLLGRFSGISFKMNEFRIFRDL